MPARQQEEGEMAPGRRADRGWRRGRALGLALGGALVAALPLTGPGAAAAPTDLRTAQMDTRPLIVDTDLGPDDVLALAWLVGQPGLDIRAITVTGTGRTTCAAGVANLRALLAALDAMGPRIGCGPETPGKGGTAFPTDLRAAADSFYGLGLPPAPDAGAAVPGAVEVLSGLLDATNDPISILALGPWTTLGKVLKDPDRAVRVASLTASLGALEMPGDVVAAAGGEPGPMEWNAHADPAAVARVFDSGVPLVLVPEDAAAQIGMSQTLHDGLAAGGDTPAARLVAQLFAADPAGLGAGFAPRDALAAVTLTDPAIIDTRERLLTVEQQGPDAGTLSETGDGMPAQVALTVDRNAFELALLSGIRGEGAAGTQAPAGLVTITGGSSVCALDPGGTSAEGTADVQAISTDVPFIAILADITQGHTVDDLREVLTTTDPTNDPPDWLLLAAYLEVDGGGSAADTADLTPGNYAAICVTEDGGTPHYLVADDLLPIGGG
jgi:pyrimidine-specific ribonucleoside hydrolase